MKFLIALFFLIAVTGYGQVDKGNSIAIPATRNNTNRSTSFPSTPTSTPSIDFSQFNKPKSDKYDITGAKGVDMTAPSETFANPAADVEKRLNQKMGNDSPELAKKENIHYGTFTITNDFIIVRYMDFGNVDGDMVKIVLNGKTIYPSLTLYGEYDEVRIPMNMGLNNLEIFALNEGLYSPNTAKFNLYELKRLMISGEWNLLTGFKAIFIVNRVSPK